MKSLIQLVIVALLLNAGFQTARSYYRYYDLKSVLQEEIHHGNVSTSTELHQRVIDMGTARGLTIEWDNVVVTKQEPATVVEFFYVEPIAFIPRLYKRPWTYEGSASAIRMRPLVFDERR